MKAKQYPTQEHLISLFNYSDGCLIWKKHHGYNAKEGTVAGYKNKKGYVVINLKCSLFYAHRFVWIWHNNNVPNGLDIDHINRVKDNNKIENLRAVTRSQNLKNNVGLGVCFHKKANKWRAYIKENGKQTHLGLFKTKEEAIKRRVEYENLS